MFGKGNVEEESCVRGTVSSAALPVAAGRAQSASCGAAQRGAPPVSIAPPPRRDRPRP